MDKLTKDQLVGLIRKCVIFPFSEQLNVLDKKKLIEILSPVKTPVNKMTYAKQELKKYMKMYGLTQKGWKYSFTNSTSCAGRTYYTRKEIKLSKIFINSGKVDEAKIRNTVLHEIAHALVGYIHHHDHVWKKKAIEIGCSGDRCCATFNENFNYIFVCEKGCELTRMRLTAALLKNIERGVCKDHGLKFKRIK
jgi:predicted SprT family Zn-dependent metalloprotease